MADKYESKATITSIKASSRRSIGIQTRGTTQYFTIEYTEERTIPEDVDMEQERTILWDTVNSEVDGQVQHIIDMFKGNA